MEAIFLLQKLIKKYRENRQDLHMVFINLVRAYDIVCREVLWWVLEKMSIR